MAETIEQTPTARTARCGAALVALHIAVCALGQTVPAETPIDDTLLHIRRQEMELASRIERLSVDLSVAEKEWQEARSQASAQTLSADAKRLSDVKASAHWEHLKALRFELDNTRMQETCTRRHAYLRRQLLKRSPSGLDRAEFWKHYADSAMEFRSKVASECQWLTERSGERRLELAALNLRRADAADSLSPAELKWLELRRASIERQIAADSTLLHMGRSEMYDRFDFHYRRATDSLRTVTVGQRARGALRRVRGLWHFEVRNVDGKTVTVGKIITAFLVILLAAKLAQLISRLAARVITKRTSLDVGIVDAGQKLFYYGFTVAFAVYALHIIQVPLTAFALAGGALALGLGFGSQNILNNFISGLILLVERPVKTGDFIEVESSVGTVETIGLRSVRIRTAGNEHLVIPNSHLLEKPVINWTLADRIVRLEFAVGVVYGSPVREVKRLLLAAAAANDRILGKPEPLVVFSDFGDNSLLFHLLFWTKIASIIDKRTILSQLRFKVNDLFGQAGITIAFPQRDVHLDSQEPLRVVVEQKGGSEQGDGPEQT